MVRVCGQPATEVDLAVRAPQVLLVRRQDLPRAPGPDVYLHRRAGETLPRDELLNHGAVAQVGVVPRRQGMDLSQHIAGQVQQGVAVPRAAVVELDQGPGRRWAGGPDALGGGQDVLGGVDVLAADRHRRPPLAKSLRPALL